MFHGKLCRCSCCVDCHVATNAVHAVPLTSPLLPQVPRRRNSSWGHHSIFRLTCLLTYQGVVFIGKTLFYSLLLVQFEINPSSCNFPEGLGFCSLRVWDVICADECLNLNFRPSTSFTKKSMCQEIGHFFLSLQTELKVWRGTDQIKNSRFT